MDRPEELLGGAAGPVPAQFPSLTMTPDRTQCWLTSVARDPAPQTAAGRPRWAVEDDDLADHRPPSGQQPTAAVPVAGHQGEPPPPLAWLREQHQITHPEHCADAAGACRPGSRPGAAMVR